MELSYSIEEMKDVDWEQVRDIYLEGIATGNATFEQNAPSWEQWNQSHTNVGRIVARSADSVVGWAALTTVSNRCVYAGVAEESVYVSQSVRGRGIGLALLSRLIEVSEEHGIWTIQAGVFPENAASLALHERCGFRKIGYRERIGKMNDVWRDVILMERRSTRIGV